MNKKILFSLVVVLFLCGCSILSRDVSREEIVQEKTKQDYIDPYLENDNIEDSSNMD